MIILNYSTSISETQGEYWRYQEHFTALAIFVDSQGRRCWWKVRRREADRSSRRVGYTTSLFDRWIFHCLLQPLPLQPISHLTHACMHQNPSCPHLLPERYFPSILTVPNISPGTGLDIFILQSLMELSLFVFVNHISSLFVIFIFFKSTS